ncbi:TonB-dependent receptor plug domain-containing protein, partial [Herbaspirillum sp.]|uniref:TonB-dependent receptor plug domain-containing protein n=1 Tax=Herbaspirillum sp. TaxID=1890675 RepID=UPI002587BBD6
MRGRFSVLWLIALLVLGLPLQAIAQEEGEADKESMEGEAMEETGEEAEAEFGEVIVVTGTRAQPRSLVESIVPIDVLSGDDFANQGDTDVAALLRNVAPSFNVNTQPISDAATVVRPASLRNMAPDHTLVLVNGKRRHRAAVIYW